MTGHIFFDCSECGARGVRAWRQSSVDAWPTARVCRRCRGRGGLTVRALALELGVRREDVYRVMRADSTRTVGGRVLAALAAKFPGAFQ